MVHAFADWMMPRHHRAAARTVSILCAVAGVSTIVLTPLQPADQRSGSTALLIAYGVVLLVILLAVLARHFREGNRVVWVLSPLVAVAAIVVVDLLTGDSSVTGQIFFAFPVLYGASQLRVPGSVVVTTASLVGEIVVVSVQLPAREAMVNAGFVAAVLVTTSVLLTHSSERQARLVARLEQMAAVDPLTGLVTRRVLDQAADSALSGATSDDGTCLIMLDVDDFKTVNDVYGHPAGDGILVQLAAVIIRGTRRGDVVCRLGGDEVAVLLPACSRVVGQQRAEDLLASVNTHAFSVDGREEALSLSVSLGLAHAPSDAEDLRSLYSAADAALYQAKRTGRGRLSVATNLGTASGGA
jgi:diguanylate cyclase (GGDEF)-like protein